MRRICMSKSLLFFSISPTGAVGEGEERVLSVHVRTQVGSASTFKPESRSIDGTVGTAQKAESLVEVAQEREVCRTTLDIQHGELAVEEGVIVPLGVQLRPLACQVSDQETAVESL